MESVPSTICKTYQARGPLQQFRFSEATAFNCFRCGDSKKSKLITVYNGDWSKRLCNGCYGLLLSIYEIKAGTTAEDERVDDLAAKLFSMVAENGQRQAERLFRISEKRAERLSSEAVRFVATAEHIADGLGAFPQLEWSPAVIGLCKAVEMEIVCRVVRPLAAIASLGDLSADKRDKDLGRVAAFCADATRKPPELGTFAHFLGAVIRKRHQNSTSSLISSFLKLSTNWKDSHWMLDAAGCCDALSTLTKNFRNRAAHTDELSKHDYAGCQQLVIGAEGILWKLLLATERFK
jgi:hypothetical protein